MKNFMAPESPAPFAVLTARPLDPMIVTAGSILTFTATATDPDRPAQNLAFTLDAGAPAGASINSSSGLFTWTPAPNQAPSTNNISVRVTDNGVPPLSATRTLTVIVLLPPHVGISHPTAGQVSLVFDTTPGRTYKVQFKNSLSDLQWQDLKAPEVAGGSTLSATDSLSANPQRFYRIIQLD